MSAAPQPADTCPRWEWRETLTEAEYRDLLQMNDLKGWASIALNWAVVFGALALVGVWPNPLTVLAAIVIIGARQLGMAVLMHEAAHRTLLKNRKLNDWVGNWLCAFPVWSDLRPYRNYHLQHHLKTWTHEDPDLGLATPFPITRESLRRKIWRDLSGQTGWKRAKVTLKRDLGRTRGKVMRDGGGSWRNLRGVVITNLVLLGILTAAGYPALYLVWVAAWFTTNALMTRIRAIAEHTMVPDTGSLLRNTRTTLASLWERFLIAPNRVNYHLEHHLAFMVPHYNLPRMHRMLRERGALEGACVANGYWSVLERASSAQPADGPPVTHPTEFPFL